MLKKFTFIALMAAMSIVGANAQAISQDEAMNNAIRFLTSTPENGGARKVMKARPRLHAAKMDVKGVYAFNVEGGGFVIASGDSRTLPVLGYGNGGSFDWDNMPQNMREWLKGYGKTIAALGNTPVSANARKADSKRQAINPMIQTYWNQSPVYNLECPVYDGANTKYKGQSTLTGCVATAMAQIMYYYMWPQDATTEIPAYDYELTLAIPSQGEFDSEPVQYTMDKIHLDKLPSTTFDWGNMLPHYTKLDKQSGLFVPLETTKQQQDAVAHLMRYCGQAIKMYYSPVVSNAFTDDAVYALRHYFGYDEGIHQANRSNYTIDGWEDLIYGELSAGRPVFYAANSSDGGHGFICDGYDGEGLYHINWGWEGEYDNYFALSVLNPYETNDIEKASDAMGFSLEQEAIIGMQPPTGNTKPASEDPKLVAQSYLSVNDNKIGVELSYYSALYPKANFKLGLFYPTENGTYETAYVVPEILSLECNTDTCITIPIEQIDHLPKDGCHLFLLYQWADKENSEWQVVGSPYMYINVSPNDNGYVYMSSINNILYIQKSYFIGSGKAMDKHDIVLEIQDLGVEYSGTVFLVPVYTNGVDPEKIFKTLSTLDEIVPGAIPDLEAKLRAGVYLKPGESQKVTFSYTPETSGLIMFVLYEENNRVPLGYITLLFDKQEFDIPYPLMLSDYEISYQKANSADDKFIQGKAKIDALVDWISNKDNGENYLKIGVTAAGKDIVAPRTIYQSLNCFESYEVSIDFLLKDKLVNDYPQTVTIYVDAIKKNNNIRLFEQKLKLGETKKGNNVIGEDAGIPDAIEKVNVDGNVKRYYDLSGRPLNGEPTTSGVYIYKDSSSKMRKVFKK